MNRSYARTATVGALRSLVLLSALFTGALHWASAQSYLGWTIKAVNVRSGPGTGYDKLLTAAPGDQLFIYTIQDAGEFYQVIHIASNTEGYVHRSFVQLGERSNANAAGLFTPTGRSATYESDLEVFNNTDLRLTLKMNGATYVFNPYQRTTLTLKPGTYTYVASAPNVIPDHGTERIDSQTSYTWQFYIETR